jgi:hypothetical protein
LLGGIAAVLPRRRGVVRVRHRAARQDRLLATRRSDRHRAVSSTATCPSASSLPSFGNRLDAMARAQKELKDCLVAARRS